MWAHQGGGQLANGFDFKVASDCRNVDVWCQTCQSLQRRERMGGSEDLGRLGEGT